MLYWYPLIFLLPSTIHAIGHPRYECGEHGRFEYCIDGVPGCVVGCHCHPGYYFDTESKICEPNAKLVQEYRRIFIGEPTRVEVPMTPPDSLSETVPTPTTTSPLDNQVDAIAKDTDDLGDWLYNQFFKTIESQVINGTDKDKPTRRSDIDSLKKKPRRFRNKKGRGSSKKIKIKNNDLRRKLLRITEDDSLFDSNSDSEENSASSDSDTSKSDTTAEEEHDAHPNDKEHGHRKILVINKKPKPPLPSFIFLPNIETQFYPPIGLPPPPPAIPMFPMIPVPPMPMPCPYPPGTTPSTTEDKKEKEEENKEKETKEKHDKDEQDKKKKENEAKENEEKEKKEKVSERSGREMTFRAQNPKRGQKKSLRQLQENMSPLSRDERKRNRKLSNRNYIYRNPDTPLFDELSPQDIPIHDELKIKSIEDSQVPAPPEDVGFKYLSQLIHKINPNLTHEDLLHKNTHGMKEPQTQPLRRTFETRYYNYDAQPEQYQSQLNQNQKYQTHQRQPLRTIDKQRFTAIQNEPDDLYYANLGQEIAALIRKVDSVDDRQVNEGIEPRENTPQPVFNENSYSSRSYWERSVRSPLQHFRSNAAGLDYIQRNYENLLNLEKKVEFVATTEHPLSLQEIENIVFLMDRAKSQLQEKIKNIKTFKVATQNLKINLLPRQNELITTKHSNKVNFNLLPRQTELSTTKQTSQVSFMKADSDDNISVIPQKSEHSNSKGNEDDINNFLPKNIKLSNSKRRNYEYEPNVLKTIVPLKYKSHVAEEYINSNSPQYNLRGILMHNFKNVAPNSDIRYVAPNIRRSNVVSNNDLTNVATNIELKNDAPNIDFRNIANDTGYRSVVPIINVRNEEINNNLRKSIPDADFSNAPNTDLRMEHDTVIKNEIPFKNMVRRNDIRKNLPSNVFSNLLRNTNSKNILFNTNILRFLLQKGIRYKNQTWDDIQTKTKSRNINHSWNQEQIRQQNQAAIKKQQRIIENLLEQETNNGSLYRLKPPRNETPPSFVMPFISNVKSMFTVPNTKRTHYQLNIKSDNSKDNNYVNNINKYGFVKGRLPFELSKNIRFDKPGPSYFHHELHHFDYFD